ncbi:MAG: right-handed parallel beta-helix repeat-containing protein [Deltaproteobacteria bacterium]|nr:right-handed parallel beta-helix repeat-containing protein [Deltaproteobacteria bacterium]
MISHARGATSAVVAAIVALATVSSASAATLKVDDDGVQCPGAYPTLQAAVAVAVAKDKIKVCPGSYSGQVVINVPLKIFGKAPKPKTCNTLAAPDPTLHSIFTSPGVPGLGGIGIDIFADGVTIQGMVFTGAGETAVRTDPANVKFSLKNSVFTTNANGVYFHSAVGSKSSVKGNCFHLNGTGVRTGYGLRDASISKNYFFGSNVAAGIIMDQLSPNTNDRIKITGNRSEGDSTFAVILGTLDSSFAKNKINGTVGTAVFVGGNNTNLAIVGNNVSDAGTRGLRFNTQFFPGFPPGGPSTGVLVTKNVIDEAGSHGIVVDSGAGESALVNSTIVKNTVEESGQGGAGDGIRIMDFGGMGANGGNTVEDNEISASFNHDCHDTTTGAGTAGTASTWTGNTATTHNVANLCFTGAANGVAD